MRDSIQALAALLLAAAILYAGNGLQTTLLAVRGNLEDFGLSQIGLLLSAYAAGFIAGCRWTPALVIRAGHIRSFTALASIASAAALVHALTMDVSIWLMLRAVTGFCFAGLSMIIESWINEKATNDNRGRILAVYRIVDLSAVMVGQLLLTLASPLGFTLFALLSILISLSLVPVALTTSIAPRPLHVARLDLGGLWRVSPLAAASCLAVGAANGAFWAVGPVFVLRSGFDTGLVAVFMTTVILAGTIAQWPLGLLSDRVDRRKVILGVALLGSASGLLLAWLAGQSAAGLLAGGALFGFFALPLFGLGAAHANDHAQPDEYMQTSAGLLLVFGIGSVVGPIIAPLFMQWAGTWALFVYTAGIHALLAAFAIYRLPQRAAVPAAAKEEFVALPESTPVVFELDPRAPELQSADQDSAAQDAGEPPAKDTP